MIALTNVPPDPDLDLMIELTDIEIVYRPPEDRDFPQDMFLVAHPAVSWTITREELSRFSFQVAGLLRRTRDLE